MSKIQEKLNAIRNRIKGRDVSLGDTLEILHNDEAAVPSTWEGLFNAKTQKDFDYQIDEEDVVLTDYNDSVDPQQSTEYNRLQHLAILERAQNRGPYKYKGRRRNDDANRDRDQRQESSPVSSEPNGFTNVLGIVLDGSLEKKGKSATWSPRHFVLISNAARDASVTNYSGNTISSRDDDDRLEIYEKSVRSYWGALPLHHKRTIYMRDVLSVIIDSAPETKGREFTVVVSADKNKKEGIDSKENATVNVLQLRAESSQARVSWTDALNDILRRRNEPTSGGNT